MMDELAGVLRAFHEATGCEVGVWRQPAPGSPLSLDAAAPPAPLIPPVAELPREGFVHVRNGGATQIVAAVPGARRSWLALGPGTAGQPLEAWLRFLLPVVGQFVQSALEVEHAARELAERYEEINLLYTISEILGRTVRLEEAAQTILTEISETVGARKASILVHDRVTDTLQVVAALGVAPEDAPPIAVDDQTCVSARVFRTQHPVLAEAHEMTCEAEAPYRRGAMLSVPIMWTTPEGGEPLGIVNLSDRRSSQPFTAGDQKLVAAIATQIGTAIQNTRLVRSSLAQQRLVQEMQLAHDLQMRLLPRTSVVAPEASVAARVVPAESVGGDFYHLFRLGESRTGFMIGDVSGHGYRAALIMALTMSAAAIHSQQSASPAATLDAIRNSLGDELDSTEMFVTLFYGVVDKARGLLRYANTGHPHAFVVRAGGAVERLTAMDPPLGMVDVPTTEQDRAWRPGDDLLLLFTDGISDARNRQGVRFGEEVVLDIVLTNRDQPPAAIVDLVFHALDQHAGDSPRPDDLTLVVVRV
jgi:sigma-B regulation protein RsbU (phosphoserine phosphatase)